MPQADEDRWFTESRYRLHARHPWKPLHSVSAAGRGPPGFDVQSGVNVVQIEVCEKPVFVLGPPRSGTSMLQWALRQHPNLWGGPESDFLEPLVDHLHQVFDYGRTRERFHWLSGQSVSWDEFLRHVGVGVNSLYSSRSGGLRWVEQTPRYTTRLDDMVKLFPDVQFLFMVRDGRQVVESLRNFVDPMQHAAACTVWRDSITAGLRFNRSPRADQMLFVSYADAVEHTETELRRVFEFLGEPFEPACVDFIRSRSPINSSFDDADNAQTTQPRWLGWSRVEREAFVEIAGDLLVELGFERDHQWVDAPLDATRS